MPDLVPGIPAKSSLSELKLLCPFSGSVLKSSKIKPHSMNAKLCKGGKSITATCPYHQVRIFVWDEDLVKILETQNALPKKP